MLKKNFTKRKNLVVAIRTENTKTGAKKKAEILTNRQKRGNEEWLVERNGCCFLVSLPKDIQRQKSHGSVDIIQGGDKRCHLIPRE